MADDMTEIITRMPEQYAWKLLRFFLDPEYALLRYRRVLGPQQGEEAQPSDLRKQVQQLGYCIRQAEEYFRAAFTVDLPTRPLLMYYGAVSLATALVLLQHDGDYALDRLPKQYRAHGLDLRLDVPGGAYKEPAAFFSHVSCVVQPRGFFSLLYQSLGPTKLAIKETVRDSVPNYFGPQPASSRPLLLRSCPSLPWESVARRSVNALDLMGSLPELQPVLDSLGIAAGLRRAQISALTERRFHSPDHGTQFREGHLILEFFVGIQSDHERTAFLAGLPEGIHRTPDEMLGTQAAFLHLKADVQLAAPDDRPSPPFLPVIDDGEATQYVVTDPDNYISELAGQFMLLYCLGMLSRYHPHVWMKAIANSRVAELASSLTEVVSSRLPCLVLDQMTGMRHYIHQG